MPPIKGAMFRYTEEDMEKAIEEVLRGQAVSTTAKKYSIPRVTLLYKARGKTPRKRKMGPQSYVPPDYEKILVKWILEMAKAGFPIQHEQLLNSVQVLMTDINKESPFRNNKPGRSWLACFLRRHPEISLRAPQNLTSARASVTKEAIEKWFSEVYEYLEEHNYHIILEEPNRVFNADETAFFFNPKGNKVLAKRGDKTVYQQVNPDEKECLTVLLTGNAEGQIVSPVVIFKYERIPKELALSVPEEWSIGKSDTGWMTGQTFFEFITNIFYPWLVKKKIALPVILFIDGHASHLTLHTSKFCAEHGIILVALYPNSTQLLQPMDVAVFRSLKGDWRNAVHQWRLDNINTPILRKINFCPLLQKVLAEKVMPSILKNGFRKCGLVPWNVNAVGFPTPKNDNAVKNKELELSELKNGINFVEKYIDREKLAAFQTSNTWIENNEDLSLFRFYKDIKGKYSVLESEIKTLNRKTKEDDTEEDTEKDTENNYLDESVIRQEKDLHNTPPPVQECNNNVAPIEQPSTGPSCNNELDGIPSPFKRLLFWPEPKQPGIKKKRKEKIPAVASSKEWQHYHENKENKKNQLLAEKKARAEERRKKKEEKEMEKIKKRYDKKGKQSQKKKVIRQKKRQHSSSSDNNESWRESGDSIDDLSPEGEGSGNEVAEEKSDSEDHSGYKMKERSYKEGEFVLVKFPGHLKNYRYTCVIQKIFESEEAEVLSMISCDETKKVYRPIDSDISVINFDQIEETLPNPEIIACGERLRYKFPNPIDTED